MANTNRKQKVLIYCAAGGNIGDTAIFLALREQLRTIGDYQVTLASPYVDQLTFTEHDSLAPTLNQLANFYLGRSWFRNSWQDATLAVRAIEDSDLTIIGGGGLINDMFGFGWLSQWLLPLFIGRLRKKRVLLLGVGAGPIAKMSSRTAAWLALPNATAITVRDEYSYRALAKVGVSPRKLSITADPAFGLTLDIVPSKADCITVIPRCDDPQNRLQPQWWDSFSDFVVRATNMPVILVAVSEREYKLLSSRISRPNVEVCRATSIAEWSQIIGRSYCVVSSRMHGCILSAISGVPIVAMENYDPKLRSISDRLSIPRIMLERLLPLEKAAGDELREVIIKARGSLNLVATRLSELRTVLSSHGELVLSALSTLPT